MRDGGAPKRNRLKILLISNLFPNPQEPTRGIFTAQLVSEIQKIGEVIVVSPIPWFPNCSFLKRFKKWYPFSQIPFSSERGGVRVYYPKYIVIPKVSEAFQGLFLFVSIFWLARRLVRASRVDVINAQWVYPDGVAASWIGKILRIPVVITGLGCDINRDGRDFKKKVQISPALRSVAKVTVVSQALKRNVLRLGVPEERVAVISNGIDFKKFPLIEKEVARRKVGLKVKEGEKIILFVGQLVPVKGLDDLIDAVSLLKRSTLIPFQVLLVGEGPLRTDLERKVAQLGLLETVFFQGQKPHEEIALWMGSCDFLTLPSVREGQPNVVLEALACGRPVVATAVGGLPDLISEERGNGRLAPPKDPQSLAKALLKSLETDFPPEQVRATVARMTWESSARMYYHEMESVLRPAAERSET